MLCGISRKRKAVKVKKLGNLKFTLYLNYAYMSYKCYIIERPHKIVMFCLYFVFNTLLGIISSNESRVDKIEF